MTRKRADRTEIFDGGRDGIGPVYREELADSGMSHDFAEWSWHSFRVKGDDYAEYPTLDERDLGTGYQNSPVVLERLQGDLTPGADPNIGNLLEGVEDDNDWAFDGTIRGESTKILSVKRKMQDFQDECREKKQKVPNNVAETVELV